jgi:hypothetical protein
MRLLIVILLLTIAWPLWSQNSEYIVVRGTLEGNDTVAVIDLNEITIRSFPIFKGKRDIRTHTKLVRNVKKVYPYARLAGIKLREYETILAEAKNDKERKRIIKEAEAELKEEFGDELRELTFSQGKILIKLVDRETGESSFELVKELRGSFSAFFYQAFARIFGYNLKVKYDPEGEDRKIEHIVQMIETGQI